MKLNHLIIKRLGELVENAEDMTFGEILYTVLRKQNFKNKPEGIKTSFLLDISDKDMYSAVENALKEEKNNG